MGKYTGEMASWLAAHGHTVRVVTAPPYYPAWHIGEGYRNAYSTEQAPGEPLVFRVPLYVPASPSGLKRMVHLFSFMLCSIPVMLRQIMWRPEVVFTVEPSFFGAPLALAVARMSDAPSWLHIQDYEVDAAFELGMLPSGGWVHRLAMRLEGMFTGRFTRVSSISAKMVARLATKGVAVQASYLFPNWVDLTEIHPISGPNRYRTELGLEDKTIVLYSGNLGNKQGLDLLDPLTASCAHDPSIHFLFCGDGSYRPELEILAQRRNNITLLPLQPVDRLNELLNAADIHLLPQRARAADLVMPSKLVGMLASGRPVIATADPDTQVDRLVNGKTCGRVVAAEDQSQLCAAVLELAAHPELRARMGLCARAYAVEHLGKDQVLGDFELRLAETARQPVGRHVVTRAYL